MANIALLLWRQGMNGKGQNLASTARPTDFDVAGFERTVLQLVNADRSVRPFLCRGFPCFADVLLVGSNPSTDTPFWDYWSSEHGCNKQAWLDEYWRRNRGRNKPTRRRIEIICNELASYHVVETNVDPQHSPQWSDLGGSDSELADYILRVACPSVILLFGAPARLYFQGILRMPRLPKGQFVPVLWEDRPLMVRAEDHFAYVGAWTDSSVKKLAEDVATALVGREPGSDSTTDPSRPKPTTAAAKSVQTPQPDVAVGCVTLDLAHAVLLSRRNSGDRLMRANQQTGAVYVCIDLNMCGRSKELHAQTCVARYSVCCLSHETFTPAADPDDVDRKRRGNEAMSWCPDCADIYDYPKNRLRSQKSKFDDLSNEQLAILALRTMGLMPGT
jgi:hypothetical protein